jgi:predicted CopG family antitoxin
MNLEHQITTSSELYQKDKQNIDLAMKNFNSVRTSETFTDLYQKDKKSIDIAMKNFHSLLSLTNREYIKKKHIKK